jgi:hypothetical protein
MFSLDFQRFAVGVYGASFEWSVRDTYYIRVIGSFVCILGSLAMAASSDPLRYWLFVVCYIEFFVLRDISRHLYSEELYAGFSVSPLVNGMTSRSSLLCKQLRLVFLCGWRRSRKVRAIG